MAEQRRSTAFSAQKPQRKKAAGQSTPVALGLRWKRSVGIAFMVTTVVVVTALFPRQQVIDAHIVVGSTWMDDTVRAPFAFPIYKDDQLYRRQQDSALAAVLPVFVPTGVKYADVVDNIQSTFHQLSVATSRPATVSKTVWENVMSLPPSANRADQLRLSEDVIKEALVLPYKNGIINVKKSGLPKVIAVQAGASAQNVVDAQSLFDSAQFRESLESVFVGRLSPPEIALAMELSMSHMKPTLLYSAAFTEEERANAMRSVPRSNGVVSQGEIVAWPGQRITEDVKGKLISLERSVGVHDERVQSWKQVLGNFGYVVILLTLGAMYLYYFRPRILQDNLQVGIICSSLLLVSILAWVSAQVHVNLPIEFLIPIPLFSMLVAILFDSRTAFYLTVIACFVVAGVRGNDYEVAIASLVAGVLAAYTVRDIKSRTQLFRSIGYSMLGYVLAIAALGLQQGHTLTELGTRVGLAAFNSTISPLLTFAAILFIETVFGVATDLKLLEYDNLNHPLLRALSDNAPGTYQHTLSIAQLTERAAAAIGANALLAKVGAYFHDIGKIAKPEYFVENQMHMGNKHDRIAPEVSARIIRDHVLDGIKLAHEYKLPQRIIDFIPMHHGTTSIRFFLDKARQQKSEIAEEQFHYPGPIPNSRETAILMLADATEATTRLLVDPTPQDIEDAVQTVIRKRFDQGQLDNCNLTLADLALIKEAFVKNLIGVTHTRIKYEDEKADDEDSNARSERPFVDDAFGNRESYTGDQSPLS